MYLRYRDYLKQIQADQLTQVIGSDSSLRVSCELTSQEDITGYLTKRYDVAKEFLGMGTFSMDTTYKARYRVELDATAYSNTATYALKAMAVQSGNVYICTTAIIAGESFDAAKWKLLGAQYDIYCIALPYDEFNVKAVYVRGDKVFWNDYIYEALTDTGVIDHQQALQFEQTYRVPFSNVFPDATLGHFQWKKGAAYSVKNLYTTAINTDYAAYNSSTVYVADNRVNYLGSIWESVTGSQNVAPDSDILKWRRVAWTYGDNRSQLMVTNMVDITLYHLHSRISPRNIPPLRCERYDSAIKWLNGIRKGTITAATLVDRQPAQGRRIRFGSEVKNTNSY